MQKISGAFLDACWYQAFSLAETIDCLTRKALVLLASSNYKYRFLDLTMATRIMCYIVRSEERRVGKEC